MTMQFTLDILREHVTELSAREDFYTSNAWNVVHALEECVIPMIEHEIEFNRAMEQLYEKYPDAFDRTNIMTRDELRKILSGEDSAKNT